MIKQKYNLHQVILNIKSFAEEGYEQISYYSQYDDNVICDCCERKVITSSPFVKKDNKINLCSTCKNIYYAYIESELERILIN